MLQICKEDCFIVIFNLQNFYINLIKFFDFYGNLFTGIAKSSQKSHPSVIWYQKFFW